MGEMFKKTCHLIIDRMWDGDMGEGRAETYL